MKKTPFTNYDFLTNDLFLVDFDYDCCMSQSFFRELHEVFSSFMIGHQEYYQHTFDTYLRIAHTACAFLTMYPNEQEQRPAEQMYELAHRYLYQAICLGGDAQQSEDAIIRPLSCAEIFFVQHLLWALLSAKGSPAIPFTLIDIAERHLVRERWVLDDFKHLCSISQEQANPDELCPFPTDLLKRLWGITMRAYYEPYKAIIAKYRPQGVDINIALRANNWKQWKEQDLTQWLCHEGKYSKDLAQRFIGFWDNEERETVSRRIMEWLNYNKGVRSISLAKAGRGLQEHMGTLKEQEEAANHEKAIRALAARGEHPMRLYLNKGKSEDYDNFLTNAVRIFNIMNRLGFFVNSEGKAFADEKAVAEALALVFDCPELTKQTWKNRLSKSIKQAKTTMIDNEEVTQCELKIFNTMLDEQKRFVKENLR